MKKFKRQVADFLEKLGYTKTCVISPDGIPPTIDDIVYMQNPTTKRVVYFDGPNGEQGYSKL